MGKKFNKTNYSQNTTPSLDDALLQSRAADSKTMWMTPQQIHNLLVGYVIMGVATPSTTPATVTGQKLCYFASEAGTYAKFNNIAVSGGINILAWNGSNWQQWVLNTKAVTSQQLTTAGIPRITTSSQSGTTVSTRVVWDNASKQWEYQVLDANNAIMGTVRISPDTIVGFDYGDDNAQDGMAYYYCRANGTLEFVTLGGATNYNNLTNKPKLNTFNTYPLPVSSVEEISGTVSLHKISKTGNYEDLQNKPAGIDPLALTTVIAENCIGVLSIKTLDASTTQPCVVWDAQHLLWNYYPSGTSAQSAAMLPVNSIVRLVSGTKSAYYLLRTNDEKISLDSISIDTIIDTYGIIAIEAIKPTDETLFTSYVTRPEGSASWFYKYKNPISGTISSKAFLTRKIYLITDGKYYTLNADGTVTADTSVVVEAYSVLMNNIGVPVFSERSQTAEPVSPRYNVLAWNPREVLWELKYVLEGNGQERIVELFTGMKVFNIIEGKYYILGSNGNMTEDTGGGTAQAGTCRRIADLINIVQGDSLYVESSTIVIDPIIAQMKKSGVVSITVYIKESEVGALSEGQEWYNFTGKIDIFKKDGVYFSFLIEGLDQGEKPITYYGNV